MLRRYVPGVGVDETVVWYEGAGFTDRRFLIADERGSVISVSDSAGAALATNTYDEYGRPGALNAGRFQYTGQAWISELGLYYYKARFYSPELKRFLQPDPIGYAGGMNLYGYVTGDPVNLVDPQGLATDPAQEKEGTECTGSRIPDGCGGLMVSTIAGPAGSRGGRVGKWVSGGTCFEDGYAHETCIVSNRYFSLPFSFFGRDYSVGSRNLTNLMASAGTSGSDFAVGMSYCSIDPAACQLNEKKWAACAADHFSFSAEGAATVGLGLNIMPTRGKLGGAIPGTSLASQMSSWIFGQAKFPVRIPTLVGLNIRYTNSIARVVGRSVPVAGWISLSVDIYSIVECVGKSE